MKWKRHYQYPNGQQWWLEPEPYTSASAITKSGHGVWGWPCLEVWHDPRTGKPWKSMKAAREWFDEVTK